MSKSTGVTTDFGFLEKVVLRGLEGLINDKFIGEIVANEWKDARNADEAMRNTFESHYMAEQAFAEMRGWTK